MPGKPRILFFDLVRIICVVFVVYGHFFSAYLTWFNGIFYPDAWLVPGLYPQPLSFLAVYGLIFVSGAVIEYNYRDIRSFIEYEKFILKRFFRLYPAYWMSLIFGLAVAPRFWNLDIASLLLQFSGMFIFTQNSVMGQDVINIMGWFIGTIFILYLLFPLLSRLLKEHPYRGILLLLAVTLVSRYILVTWTLIPGYAPWRWFPLCNLFEFGLGIFLVRQSMYPKNSRDHPLIGSVADLTFYVFLFNIVVIQYIGPVFYFRYYEVPHFGLINYFIVIAELIVVSVIAMLIDKRIQKWIRRLVFPDPPLRSIRS